MGDRRRGDGSIVAGHHTLISSIMRRRTGLTGGLMGVSLIAVLVS
jgi:hypothetical protein